MKNKFLYLTVALGMMLGFSSCNLDTFPSDELNSDLLLQDAKGAEYIMDGCYAILKDEVEFLGYSSGNCYVRHYFQLSEFPADNICLSAHTTDPLYEATAYMMNDGLKNVGTLWMVAYKAIYMTNTVIETLDESKEENHQLLGEAYFMRGLLHLHMVTLYALPYSFGRDNLGVPLRTSTSSEVTKRNPVGEVYDQIAKDLRKAADLMGKSRGNAGYPCHDAALGVLSRVYLYMEEYDKCIETVNEALNGADPMSKLEPTATFPQYFVNAKTSGETLFCIAHETSDTRGQSSIGSMFLKDGIGWGEIYPSDPLMYLYERYPMDVRYTGFLVPQFSGKPGKKVYVTIPATDGDPEEPHIKARFDLIDDGAGNYSFKEDGKTYNIEKRTVNGEYVEYHVNYLNQDCLCRINDDVTLRTGFTIPMIFINKFSYQDGDPMLSSPVMCRWGEVILNRAEAYARSGKDAEALADVNVIRTRAGIPTEGLFAAGKMHGYANAADVVMDERRLELAWEGHRHFDMCRNKLKMDRRYAGAQPFKVIDPTTEPHIIYPIPNNEWTVSGIEQNPGY
ncbi:MAG: RagB/SusD family nutrient uptake outer membrane protein [Paludibacteraceae bacterium]|nr:RagB/SusD family nutrient uptake outer membrane protein [Paludibacteraceae bacterium]